MIEVDGNKIMGELSTLKNGIMEDGCILPSSDSGNQFGFTKELFGCSWLWKHGDSIYTSFIRSEHPGKGNLSRLFDNILKAGYKIKVPTPLGRMQAILIKKGFKQTYEDCEMDPDEPCEVWIKEP